MRRNAPAFCVGRGRPQLAELSQSPDPPDQRAQLRHPIGSEGAWRVSRRRSPLRAIS